MTIDSCIENGKSYHRSHEGLTGQKSLYQINHVTKIKVKHSAMCEDDQTTFPRPHSLSQNLWVSLSLLSPCKMGVGECLKSCQIYYLGLSQYIEKSEKYGAKYVHFTIRK